MFCYIHSCAIENAKIAHDIAHKKTGLFRLHQVFKIAVYPLVVLSLFFFDGVLVRRFQHIVCGVAHAFHAVLIWDS